MTQTGKLYHFFLYLLRLGIGNESITDSGYTVWNTKSIDWGEVEALAVRQGLLAIVYDAVMLLKTNMDCTNDSNTLPSQETILRWIGRVMQEYEQRYEAYSRAIGELAKFYNSHDLKMMVLKGYACSLDWPKPNHRPCGDIDIWQFGQQEKADDMLAQEAGVVIDRKYHHHTVFFFLCFVVENHYDFLNVHHHRSNVEMEKILKELGRDDSNSLELNIEVVKETKRESSTTLYLPSANLHALLLIRHASSHFAAEGITLRNILDWAFFVKAHGNDVDWEWLHGVLERFGLMPIFKIFNDICVYDLGFLNEKDYVDYFKLVDCKVGDEIRLRVLRDILTQEVGNKLPKELLHRVVFKIHRWKANKWKRRLCYNDSTWSTLWNGIWNHVLKPASI